MKKILITTMMNLFCIICFGQNYTIKSEGVEDVVANYAKEIIDENISIKSGYEYEFTLLQDGSTFTISYLVNPNNITGQEQTNDLWSEIEQTIKRALNAIDSQIEDIAITQKKEEKQKAKKEEKQRDEPVIAEKSDSLEQNIQQNDTVIEKQKQKAEKPKNTIAKQKKLAGGNFFSNKIKKDKIFLGANAGLGFGHGVISGYESYYDAWGDYYSYSYSYPYNYFAFNLGVDCTYEITDALSVGGFLSLGLSDSFAASFGPIVKYDLYGEKAIIGGLGLNLYANDGAGVNIRAGYKHSKLYFFGECAITSDTAFLIHVGYTLF